MVSSVTTFSTMDPSPRVRIDISGADLSPSVYSATIWQISKWGQVPVRNAQNALAVGGLVVDDYEIPPGVEVTYRVEQFDATGAALGYAPVALTAQIDWDPQFVVVQDPLQPSKAVFLRAELRFADSLKRSRPTAVYQAGGRAIAMSGVRSAFQDVLLRCMTMNSAERDEFDAVVGESLILVRSMPELRLPGSFYATVPQTVLVPFNAHSGGDVDVWDISGSQVSRPTLDVVVAVYSYDLFKAYLDALHPPTPGTYDDAAALWSTYLDAMRNPPPAA